MGIKLSELTCNQLYQIWASDPHWLEILDLRTQDKYENSHIPGARLYEVDLLENYLKQLDLNKTVVLVFDSEKEEGLINKIKSRYDNVLTLNNCQNWESNGFVVMGNNKNLWSQIKNEVTMKTDTIFYQLFEPQTSTYTYIIGDAITGDAAIIDPVLETVERDLKLINELKLNLIYVLDTHVHADHITGASEIKKHTQAKTGVSKKANVSCADLNLEEGQELLLGSKKIRVLETPGHTNGCLSFYFDGRVFTGDSLLIRGCGRTDFQQGSSSLMYDSIVNKLFSLPDEVLVYPGHDYRGFTHSTIGMEKKFNPRINVNNSKDSFVKIMSELKLADPKKIHEAVPANLYCGRKESDRFLNPQISDGIPEVSVHQVMEHKKNLVLVDVRRPDEFNGEYGHIEGSKLVVLGPDLLTYLQYEDKNKEIVFICRSGGRSGQATAMALEMGYKYVSNMVGGMITWSLQQLPVVRD